MTYLPNFKDPKGYGTLNLEVKGLPELNSYLKRTAGKSKLALGQSMQQIGMMMEAQVRASVAGAAGEPRSIDTGFFHDSIHSRATQDSVTIADRTSYGKFLEKGTTRINARHHFTKSFTRNLKNIYNIIRFNLQRATK